MTNCDSALILLYIGPYLNLPYHMRHTYYAKPSVHAYINHNVNPLKPTVAIWVQL